MSAPPLLLNIEGQFSLRSIRKDIETKDTRIRNEDGKLHYSWVITLYIEIAKENI
jgi:hypothetical protein